MRRLPDQDELKRTAAERALLEVRSGMLLGVGTGTTARFFIEGLARLVAAGYRLEAVPTSAASAEMARRAGLQVVEDVQRPIDLAVDGADEIGPGLGLVKGHGGALFREKLVAVAADRFLVIADESKLVERLGMTLVPVEVLPFMWTRTAARVEELGARWRLRETGRSPYLTDNGNYILDLSFPGGLEDPEGMAAKLKQVTGVLEHGLFLGMAEACLVAGGDGVRWLDRSA